MPTKAQPTRFLPRKAPVPGNIALVPTVDEFATWCEHPVTRWVAAAYAASAEQNKQQWLAATWNDDLVPPEKLALMRVEYFTRADAYKSFLATAWEDYLHTNNFEAWNEWRRKHVDEP
jgi:hypothetical protein